MGNTKHLYHQIADSVIRGIADNEYGDQLPTETVFAKQFGVSVPTIKRALAILVEDDIVTRIPGKGTFVKNKENAQSIAQGTKHEKTTRSEGRPMFVGVILPGHNDSFSTRLLNGIVLELATQNAHALLGITQDSRERESEIIRGFLQMGVDGLIIFPVEGELYNEDIVRLSLEKFPLVLIDRWMPGIDVSRVVSQHALGMKQAVDHLLSLGHRQIACVSVSSEFPLSTQSIIERKEGFLRALSESGLTSDERFVWMSSRRDRSPLDTMDFITERILENPDVSALVGISAADTHLVLQVLTSLGKNVPEDISVIGFDVGNVFRETEAYVGESDVDRFAWLDQSEDLIGKQGASLICKLITRPGNSQVLEVPIHLHPGKSCSVAKPRALKR